LSNSYTNTTTIASRLALVEADLSYADVDLLQAAIDWASDFIDDWCHRVFSANHATRYYTRHDVDPCDSHLLYLGEDLVRIDAVSNGDTTNITGAEYVLEPRNADAENRPYYALRLLSTSAFVWPTDGYVQVSGLWGYSSAPDAVIVGCCLRLAEYHYRSKAPQTSTTLFDGSLQKELPQGFPTDVLTVLDQRKRLAS